MRLGQLSRKLSIRTGEILEFLSANNIPIENDSNARLDDAQVNLIMRRFAPDLLESTPSDSQPEAIVPEVDHTETIELPSVAEKSIEAPTQKNEVQDEVIKAPKVELSGLKILGKIDLPERKKKEATPDTDPSAQRVMSGPENKRPDRRRGHKDQQGDRRKNPIALQREREAMEAEKKRQERALQEKEQRTQNYLRRVKTAAPTKSARLIEEPTEELSKIEDAPTTLLGRFFRWLKH